MSHINICSRPISIYFARHNQLKSQYLHIVWTLPSFLTGIWQIRISILPRTDTNTNIKFSDNNILVSVSYIYVRKLIHLSSVWYSYFSSNPTISIKVSNTAPVLTMHIMSHTVSVLTMHIM